MQFEYDPEKLISEVEKRPGIWDFDDFNYRSKAIKLKLWREIVAELLRSQPDVQLPKSEFRELEIQLQKKWKSIRDCYQKFLTNPNRFKRPYIYSKQLHFLAKNNRNHEIDPSCSDEPPKQYWRSKKSISYTKEEPSSEEASDNNDEPFMVESVDEIPLKMPRLDLSKQTTGEFVFASVDPQKYEVDDPDRMFLLSLLPHLKSIPEQSRIHVKMELMKVLSNNT